MGTLHPKNWKVFTISKAYHYRTNVRLMLYRLIIVVLTKAVNQALNDIVKLL